MNEELKPCPHCGNEAKLVERAGGWTVDCKAANPWFCITNNISPCNCDGGTVLCATRELAVSYWNTRPIEDQLRAEILRLQLALEDIIEAGSM
jgi:hypothetical protein